ncbi:hypothetical protein SLA2020_105040 [Shorea laevis]
MAGANMWLFVIFLSQHGISHFTTPPYTPELSGISECRNRHIVESGLALLHTASLPSSFRSFAFLTATYLINRLPSQAITNKSPFEKLFRLKPNYHKLRVFGCLCFPWLRPYNSNKLQYRSRPCLFVRYSSENLSYKCLDLSTQKLFYSRHVIFQEHTFPAPFKNSCLQPPAFKLDSLDDLPPPPAVSAVAPHESLVHEAVPPATVRTS